MAVIYVERDSQKGIIIGKGGKMLKQVGRQPAKTSKRFLRKSVSRTLCQSRKRLAQQREQVKIIRLSTRLIPTNYPNRIKER